jgi:membrane-associated protein
LTTGDTILPSALIPWLDPATFIPELGSLALVVVCLIVFAETGLLVGFILPGDTLLIITGLLAFPVAGATPERIVNIDIWWVCLAISFAAFLGGESGYFIGRKAGPRIFERKESGFFSIENVRRTNHFFERFGGLAVIVARFVPIVRTFAPVAAGVGHMNPRKYSLYNAVGALLWGAGLTYAGYLLGHLPPVADFVTKYIDIILLCAVLIAVVPTTFHYVRSLLKARKNRGLTVPTEAEVALDASVFDQKRSNDVKRG